MYLAGGVVAAFKCKVTLKASHINEALENSTKTSIAILNATDYEKHLNHGLGEFASSCKQTSSANGRLNGIRR